LKLKFRTIAEPTQAGVKWQQLFNTSWPSYKLWLEESGFAKTLSLQNREDALKKYMPKMWDTYVHLSSLLDTENNEYAKNFLTGYCPPAYFGGCAQAVFHSDTVQLIRNYDYHPELLEGTLLLTKWNSKKVIGSSDCISGLLDGMNEDGLCVSLTFGGRRQVGLGFGIPFILRYVLEFCSTTKEAVAALKSIPCHMSYNVTIVDKSGAYKTILLAPDKAPVLTHAAFATNHQQKVNWAENAEFNQTIKRANFLKSFLKTKNVSASELTDAFLHPPLYNSTFKEGFGTLYTAVYEPENLTIQLHWPDKTIQRSFDVFEEEQWVVSYLQDSYKKTDDFKWQKVKQNSYNWQEAIVNSLVSALARKKPKIQQDELREKLMPNGHIAWEAIIDYWNKPFSK
jgi:predicted choloylglycine hydrolase